VNKKPTFRSALFAGAMILSLGAMAEQQDASVSILKTTVKYNRTAASTPVGAAELYTTLNTAASRVCVDSSGPLVAQGGATFANCRDAALSRAVSTVAIEAVTELHGKNDRSRGPAGVVTVAN